MKLFLGLELSSKEVCIVHIIFRCLRLFTSVEFMAIIAGFTAPGAVLSAAHKRTVLPCQGLPLGPVVILPGRAVTPAPPSLVPGPQPGHLAGVGGHQVRGHAVQNWGHD